MLCSHFRTFLHRLYERTGTTSSTVAGLHGSLVFLSVLPECFCATYSALPNISRKLRRLQRRSRCLWQLHPTFHLKINFDQFASKDCLNVPLLLPVQAACDAWMGVHSRKRDAIPAAKLDEGCYGVNGDLQNKANL
jgi:hypothetical protein